MEIWEQFLGLEYANYILMAVGALLLLWGILKILGSSIKLIFWVLLAALGGTALAYGLELSDLPVDVSQELKDLAGPGKELSAEAVQSLCEKFKTNTLTE